MLTDRPRINSFALAGLLLAAGWLCTPASARTTEKPTRTVVDETGRVVRVPTRIERIITLVPSLTEIVYALGLEDRLVGVTNQCDYPPAAQQKPRVGDVINPNLEMIVELKPDVVLGSKVDNLSKTVEAIKHLGVPLYGLYPTTVQGVLDSIRHIAELAGVAERGAGRALASATARAPDPARTNLDRQAAPPFRGLGRSADRGGRRHLPQRRAHAGGRRFRLSRTAGKLAAAQSGRSG